MTVRMAPGQATISTPPRRSPSSPRVPARREHHPSRASRPLACPIRARARAVGRGRRLLSDDTAGSATGDPPRPQDHHLELRRALPPTHHPGEERPNRHPPTGEPAPGADGAAPARRTHAVRLRWLPDGSRPARWRSPACVPQRPRRCDAVVPRPRDGLHGTQQLHGAGRRTLHRGGRCRGEPAAAPRRVRRAARHPEPLDGRGGRYHALRRGARRARRERRARRTQHARVAARGACCADAQLRHRADSRRQLPASELRHQRPELRPGPGGRRAWTTSRSGVSARPGSSVTTTRCTCTS